MKMFILRVNHSVGWDTYDAKVIIAKNKNNAREIANRDYEDEGEIWQDETKVSCEVVDLTKEYELLGSFNAG